MNECWQCGIKKLNQEYFLKDLNLNKLKQLTI